MKANTIGITHQKSSSMKKGIFTNIGFSFLLLMMSLNLFPQGSIIHTSDIDFNKGFTNQMQITGGDAKLPLKATSLSTWTTTQALPVALKKHKTVLWNNRVYVSGGLTGAVPSSQVYMSTLTTVLGTWTTLNPLPVPLYDHEMVVANGYLYVLGGKLNGNPVNTIYYAWLKTDGTIGPWQTSAVTLPQPLWGLTVEFVNGYFYIAGGSNQSNDNTALSTVYSVNVGPEGELSAFTTLTAMPEAKNMHTMVVFGKNLYVLGGFDNSYNLSKTVYFTELDQSGGYGSWTAATDLPAPVFGHASTCSNGLLTVIGGYLDTSGNATNVCNYADLSASPALSWQISGNYYPHFFSYASAIAVAGKIVILGGFDIFNSMLASTYFNDVLTLANNFVQKGSYLSSVIDLGVNRLLNQLIYVTPNLSGFTFFYRTAIDGSQWNTWVNGTQNDTITLNTTNRYLQYLFLAENASTSTQIILSSVKLNFNATTVSGTLTGTNSWTAANSPYLVTGDLLLQSGTLTIGPGVSVLFSDDAGLEIGQASLVCNGTQANPVIFTSAAGDIGTWDGLYFNDNSDNGVTSTLNYTIVEKSGSGTRLANVYCSSTNQPVFNNFTSQYSTGKGMYLTNSSPVLNTFVAKNNTSHGFCIQGNSFPKLNNASFTGNLTDGIAVLNSTISNSGTWYYSNVGYILWENVTVSDASKPKLTIAPGNLIKGNTGVQLLIGSSSYGQFQAIGKPDSLITFTSYNNTAGGWNGIAFNSLTSTGNGCSSIFKYCIIEKANQYNLLCTSTDQPVIDICTIRNGLTRGLGLDNSSNSISNSTIENNQEYGIYLYSASPNLVNNQIKNNVSHGLCLKDNSFPRLFGNTFTGNLTNAITRISSTISTTGTWKNFGVDYVIWGDILIQGSSKPILTIAPGNVIKVKNGFQLRTGEGANNYGQLQAIGKADSLITFTSFDNSVGGWNGLYFGAYSSNGYGCNSSLKYCIIEKGNQYNVYCTSTNQPLIDNCTIKNGLTKGLYLNSASNTIGNSVIETNGEYGVYLNSSSPNMFNNQIRNNISHGLCMELNCSPQLLNTSMSGNLTNGIATNGGTLSSSVLWKNCGLDYIIWGDISISNWYYSGRPRLTIQKGNTIKFNTGIKFNIGQSDNSNGYNGELYAEGTADSLITFTSLNGNAGGWEGLWFRDGSDYSSSTSSLKFCIIEKANQSNINCYNTNQPVINNCTIKNGATKGVSLTSSSITIGNSMIEVNSEIGVYLNSSSPNLFNNQIRNNGSHGLLMEVNCFPQLLNISMSGNLTNGIGVNGGTISSSGLWMNCGLDYIVCGDISISNWYYSGRPRLTIQKGNTIKFNTGIKFNIGQSDNSNGYNGELYAVGTSDSLITFTSLDGSAGGWEGLWFREGSDYNSSVSSLKYCIIEKSNQNNINCYNTNQPLIDNCTIKNGAAKGVYLTSSSITIGNSVIEANSEIGVYLNSSSPNLFNNQIRNNGSHGLLMEVNCFPQLLNISMSGNLTNGIGVNGGTISSSGLWMNCGLDYIVWGDISISNWYYSGRPRLTIQKGNTIKFNTGIKFNIGQSDNSNGYNGELYAVGTSDSLITFTSLDGSAGGWEGLWFREGSDYNSSVSSLKYCIIEKANQNNINCYNTNQPVIENCIIKNAAQYGIYLTSSSPSIGNSAEKACDLYYNGLYDIYNNSSNAVQAKYNFWNTKSNYLIGKRIFDYYDNSSKGIVNYAPFNSDDSIPVDQFDVAGTIIYDNSDQTPIPNMLISLKDFNTNPIDSTITNSNGQFAMNDFENGPYIANLSGPEWTAGNSTDALLVMQHFTHLITLSGLKLKAADVNCSHTVNGTDALLIMERFVGMISSFPCGDWVISTDSLIVYGSDFTLNENALFHGDVNGSYVPGSTDKGSTISINYQGQIVLQPNQEYLIPFTADDFMNVGALSLKLEFPSDCFDIHDAFIGNQMMESVFNVSENECKIAWANIESLNLLKGDTLFVLKIKTKELVNCTEPIQFLFDPSSEIVNENAVIFSAVNLTAPELTTFGGTTNTDFEKNYKFAVNIYPNPFKDKTMIGFTLPETGVLQITIIDKFGTELFSETRQVNKGDFNSIIPGAGFSKGINYVKIAFKTVKETYTRVEKIIKL